MNQLLDDFLQDAKQATQELKPKQKVQWSSVWHQRRSNSANIRPQDHRSPFERDRSRILHSAAFRRLQAKTQIQGIGENDFYRTRLTHSLEVAQIGSSIVPQLQIKHPELSEKLNLDERLTESLCLAHDIGHPPFGHGGEIALNYKMRYNGGFEGNGQTLRILSKLEPYTEAFGMDLTRRTLLGLVKYPNTLGQLTKKYLPKVSDGIKIQAKDWKPAKGVFDDDVAILQWIAEPLSEQDRQLFADYHPPLDDEHGKSRYKSVDASIMELADDIAYGVHDLEDAIVVGNISKDLWYQEAVSQCRGIGDSEITELIEQISPDLFDVHHKSKGAIGQLVNMLVTSVELVNTNEVFDEPMLAYNAQLAAPQHQLLDILKKFVYHHVICKPQIQQMEFKGQRIVMDLFDAFSSDPVRLLPNNTKNRWLKANEDEQNPLRVVCDYIAGMTDDYACTMYKRMFMA